MIRFLQISDLHYLNDYYSIDSIFAETTQKMTNPLIQMDKLLHNQKPFDFVLITGDLCEFGKVDDYLTLKNKLTEYFNCPIIATAGNHDNKKAYCKGFLNCDPKEDIVEEYYLNGIRIISLDSSSESQNDGIITLKSLEKLKKYLKEDSLTDTFIISHHHLLEKQYKMKIATYPDELINVLDNDCIIAILTGHTHHPYKDKFANKDYYAAGCLSFMGEDGKNEGEVDYFDHPSCNIYEYENKILKCTVLEDKETRYIATVNFKNNA